MQEDLTKGGTKGKDYKSAQMRLTHTNLVLEQQVLCWGWGYHPGVQLPRGRGPIGGIPIGGVSIRWVSVRRPGTAV